MHSNKSRPRVGPCALGPQASTGQTPRSDLAVPSFSKAEYYFEDLPWLVIMFGPHCISLSVGRRVVPLRRSRRSEAVQQFNRRPCPPHAPTTVSPRIHRQISACLFVSAKQI